MTRKRIHTLESCIAAAVGCTSRKQFARKNRASYEAAYRSGWLDEMFAKVETPEAWTKERVAEVAKLYASRQAMRKSEHQWAYKTAKRKGWFDALPGPATIGDNDTFYMWKAKTKSLGDKSLYKIGVTSQKYGTGRITTVAKAAHLEVEEIYMRQAADANKIEHTALAFGEPAGLTGFVGCTEFRLLSDAEVVKIKNLIARVTNPALTDYVL